MITLGGLVLNDNMYLSGLESAKGVVYSQRRTITGVPILNIASNPGGRLLTLGTQDANTIQGIWCKELIDQVKVLELLASELILDYRGTTYAVVIIGTDFKPLLQHEAESPTKKFTGNISLLEV